MSFQDLQNSGGRDRSLRSAPSPSQDVSAALFQINTAVATFRRLVEAIGTSKDTPDHRLKLENTRQRIMELVKETSAKLKSLTESANVDPSRRVQDDKIAKDFQTTLQEFQKVQQLASQRESTFTPVSLSTTSNSSQYEEPNSERENEPFLMEQKSQTMTLLDNEVSFNEVIIEERDQGIKEIQDQVVEANEVFKDLAVLIHDQSLTIDDVGRNIEASGVATTQAKVLVSRASKSGRSKASWCWWVLAIVVVVVVVIVVLILIL